MLIDVPRAFPLPRRLAVIITSRQEFSNWRVFQHRWEYPNEYDDVCALDEVEKTLTALKAHGYQNAPGYRQVEQFAEKLRKPK
jgi:hypothetical protein